VTAIPSYVTEPVLADGQAGEPVPKSSGEMEGRAGRVRIASTKVRCVKSATT